MGQVLADANEASRPLGSIGVLQQYYERQQADQVRTVQFSDLLPDLFMRADPVLGLARDMGLAGLDMLPAAKREFVRYAAGLAAFEEPRRA